MKALFFENDLVRVALLKAASFVSKDAVFGPFSSLRYAEVPEPRLPNERWLKVRNIACGLCGTDIHFMFMHIDPKSFPAALPGIARKFLGHELVGEVVEAGAEVDTVAVGDRVAMRIDWPSCRQLEIDPMCPQCAGGNYMLCERVGTASLPLRDTGGGFSPSMVMHKSQPYRIPDALSLDQALLLEPLASAAHGILKLDLHPGQRALIIGSGTLGLMSLAALRGLFPDVEASILARHPFQQRVAEKLGGLPLRATDGVFEAAAERTGARPIRAPFGNRILLGGFDAVVDTVGSDATLNQALRLVRGGGQVVVVGINFMPGKIDYTPVWAREIRLTGISCHATEADGRNSFDVAADLLAAGCLDPADIITHRFALDDYKNAVKTFLDKRGSQAIKIVLEISA